MCKPQQRGWAEKNTLGDLRHAVAHEQEIRDWHEGELTLNYQQSTVH